MRSKPSAALSLLLTLLGSAAAVANAAETSLLPLPRRPHYVFQRIGENFGLGSLPPSCILQDQDGFIWIGTANGLLRFDGNRLMHFGLEDGLASTNVNQLVLARNGRIWVVTARGISYVESGTLHRLPLAKAY